MSSALFARVELMGHVTHVGRVVREDETFPGLTRLETFDTQGQPRSIWFAPGSVYRIAELTAEEHAQHAAWMAGRASAVNPAALECVDEQGEGDGY